MKGTSMKLWTLAGEKTSQGILVVKQPFPHVKIGKRMLPLGKRDFPAPPERLMAADLYTTQKGTTLLVAEKDPTDPIGLILTVEPQNDPWFREWTLNQYEEVACPLRGRVGNHYNCPVCGIKYPAHCYQDLFSPANAHPDKGMALNWKEFQETDGIQTVMSGYVPPSRADEWGYRSAGYSEYLMRMCPGESLRMHSGVHGEPQYDSEKLLIWTGEELLYLETWELQGEHEQYRARSW